MRLQTFARIVTTTALITLIAPTVAHAWGRDGHMLINRLAAENLPPGVPTFLRDKNAVTTLEYLGPEPDRWKNRAEKELSDTQSPDHFLDYEWAILAATPCTNGPDCDDGYKFPRERYDWLRALNAAKLPPEVKRTESIGFQPWEVEEIWQRLKTDLREYRKLVAAKLPTGPVEDAILFDAGWMGHYVGDGSQPLHLTIQYNGWNGPNPNGYTTDHKIHAQFESIYVTAHIKHDDVAPLVAAAKPVDITDEWNQYFHYIDHSHSLVEKVYQLDKTGAFTDTGTPEGKTFTDERLAAGAIELRDLIYSAWVHSADPVEEYRGPQ
jgi:hypothetical protein